MKKFIFAVVAVFGFIASVIAAFEFGLLALIHYHTVERRDRSYLGNRYSYGSCYNYSKSRYDEEKELYGE